MITEDVMDICREPDSSQPYAYLQSQRLPRHSDEPTVWWEQKSPREAHPALRDIHQNSSKVQAAGPSTLQHSAEPPLMDVQSVQTVSAVRRPGNVNHPAHMPRHVVYIKETQDPEVQQAAAEFAAMVSHTAAGVQKRSAKKAGKVGHNPLENVKPCAEGTLQRRHTSEDVQPTPRIPAQRKVAKTHSADPKAGRTHKRSRQDTPMNEDEPVAGPSKSVMYTIFKPVPGVSFGDDEDEEAADGGMPSSTPTPPPKHRVPQRGVSSASSASSTKGKARRYSEFSESPTSLQHDPHASLEESASYAPACSKTTSPLSRRSHSHNSPRKEEHDPEPDPSPLIPSPNALAGQPPPPHSPLLSSVAAMLPPLPPAHALSQSRAPSQSHRPTQSRALFHPHAPSQSRLPANFTQSPGAARPFVPPSASQGTGPALASEVPRASQRGQRVLGMRPIPRTGGGGDVKYRVGGFKVPSFKTPAAAVAAGVGGGGGGGHSKDAAAARRGCVGGQNGGEGSAARVPVVEMSARKPEPMDVEEGGKDADSSYGDIPFEWDMAAVEKAMEVVERPQPRG